MHVRGIFFAALFNMLGLVLPALFFWDNPAPLIIWLVAAFATIVAHSLSVRRV